MTYYGIVNKDTVFIWKFRGFDIAALKRIWWTIHYNHVTVLKGTKNHHITVSINKRASIQFISISFKNFSQQRLICKFTII